MLPAPPGILVERIRKGQCVLFAGAGLSIAAKLPSWPSLLRELIAELPSKSPDEIRELEALMQAGKLLTVAEHCQERLGLKRFAKTMAIRFGGDFEVPSIHRRITQLPLCGVITTNYDKLFERAYGNRLTVRTHLDPGLTYLPLDPRPFLLKAHGDIDQPENLVLTERDYRRVIHSNPQFKMAFQWAMFGNAILFAGYSLNDPDIRLWLDGHLELMGGTLGRFALLSGVGPIERETLRRTAGIDVLSYPEGRHEMVEEFMVTLLRSVENTPIQLEVVASPEPHVAPLSDATDEFVARLESLSLLERARHLTRPTQAEQIALARHYGRDRWLQIRQTSLQEARRARANRGHVIFIPTFLGSELTVHSGVRRKRIWLSLPQLMFGGFAKLRLRGDGQSDWDVRPTGILKKYYAEVLLNLVEDWNVHVFFYDWRLDFDETAAVLDAQIARWLPEQCISHILAHGTGGIVARTFIRNYPERWKAMFDDKSEITCARGGRLVMLGASQTGSLIVPQLITGASEMLRKLAIVDLRHNLDDISEIYRSWPALYQMLPSPFTVPAFSLFYESRTYGDIGVSQRHLDRARVLHEKLLDVVDPARMTSLFSNKEVEPDAASGRSILSETLRSALAASPHAANQVSRLITRAGEMIPTYQVNVPEWELLTAPEVLSRLTELLETGVTFSLPQEGADA